MNNLYRFELTDGSIYDSNNDKILLLHPMLLRENVQKIAIKHSDVITYYSKENEGLIIARNLLDKFGVFDVDGNMIVDFIYDKIGTYNEGLASFKKNDKWGFIDKKGKIVIEPIFDMVYNFNEGYAKVEKNGYYGLIRKDGQLAIECNLINVSNVVNGIAMVKPHNYVKINEQGVFITGSGINFLGSVYYYKNKKEKYEQQDSIVIDAKNKKKSKVNLFDLIDNGEQEIKKYKLDMQIVKNISDEFDKVPLAYDLENKTLIVVKHWEKIILPEQTKNNSKIKKMI